MTLTPDQIRDYHTDGFTIAEGLIKTKAICGFFGMGLPIRSVAYLVGVGQSFEIVDKNQ